MVATKNNDSDEGKEKRYDTGYDILGKSSGAMAVELVEDDDFLMLLDFELERFFVVRLLHRTLHELKLGRVGGH